MFDLSASRQEEVTTGSDETAVAHSECLIEKTLPDG